MWLRHTAWRRRGLRFVCAGVLCCLPSIISPMQAAPDRDQEKDKHTSQPPVVRWAEEHPGCTFSSGDDGKYHYDLWSGDLGIFLAVDARELQVIRHRDWPLLGVFLTIRYRGAGGLDTSTDAISLQFMKHFRVLQSSLDPDDYSQKIQNDADAFEDETRRAVAKHPEEKPAREARLQDYEKSANEMIEFLSAKSFRSAHLDRANPEVSGWVFFNTRTKWLGSWKTQEEFVFRLPLDGKVFEFPFKLPPEKHKFLLQKRE